MEESSKKLNLFDLLSIGVGSVIGAGIFSMLGMGIAMTGRSIVLALILAMFVVFFQQMRPLFMSSMFALEGGMYSQQAIIFPRVLTGMGALIMVMSNLSFSVFGISIASYLAQLFPSLGAYQKIIGIIVLTLFFGLSFFGTKTMAKVQNIMVLIMYAALALFVVYGIANRNPVAYAGEPYAMSGLTGFLMATAIMSFTCNGASNIINLAGSTKNAKRNIPLGFILTTVVCAVIYAALAFAATGGMSYSNIAGQNLGYIAQQIMPASLYIFFIVGGAMFALTTTLLGGISAMAQPIVASADDGWLPKIFSKRTEKGFPITVMATMYLISIIPVIGGFTLDTIVSFIMVPGMILNICGIFFSFKLPKKFPKQWAACGLHCPYWVYILLMIVSVLASLLTAVFALLTLNMVGAIGNLTLTAILFFYAWYRNKKGYVNLKNSAASMAEEEAQAVLS